MGSLNVNFDYAAYLRNMQVQLVEGQSKAGLDAGNVALKTPVYDWGYSGQFGDEINWGSSIVQVPYLLYKLYGDTQTMREHYDAMKTYMDFVARRKADATTSSPRCSPTGSPSEQTSQQLSGTWGYYLSAKYMSEMAALTGRNADAAAYADAGRRTSRPRSTPGSSTRRCTATPRPATAARPARPRRRRPSRSTPASCPRASGRTCSTRSSRTSTPTSRSAAARTSAPATIGLGPVVRSLLEGGRSDVLWDVMQEDTRPSYGFMHAADRPRTRRA